MNTVLRAFNATVDDVNTTERTMVAKINSARLDYYRTVIDPRGSDFRDYQRSPVVLWCHGKDMKNRGELPVGRNLWIRADKGSDPKIIAKTRFAKDDFSQALYEAYRDGDLTGWSLSMVPKEFGPPTEREIRERPELHDCEIVYRSWSLSEYSCVPCPGNPDCLTVDEARSLGKVVCRGIGLPDTYQEALDRLPELQDAFQTYIDSVDNPDRMSSCDGASGGYLIKPDEKDEDEDEDEEEEDRDKPADDEKKKKKKSEKDEKPGDEADGDEDDKPKGNERTIIELPDLVNARTFAQIFHTCRNDELQFREMLLKKMQEQIDWYFGKV